MRTLFTILGSIIAYSTTINHHVSYLSVRAQTYHPIGGIFWGGFLGLILGVLLSTYLASKRYERLQAKALAHAVKYINNSGESGRYAYSDCTHYLENYTKDIFITNQQQQIDISCVSYQTPQQFCTPQLIESLNHKHTKLDVYQFVSIALLVVKLTNMGQINQSMANKASEIAIQLGLSASDANFMVKSCVKA